MPRTQTPDAPIEVETDAFPNGSDPDLIEAAAQDAADETAAEAETRLGYDSTDSQAGEEPAFQKLEVLATLQDGGFVSAQSGVKYNLKFEVDIVGFIHIAGEYARGRGGYDVEWNGIKVGTGAEVRTGAFSRDTDGAPHFRLTLLLPGTELQRSIGRMAQKTKMRAKLVLSPMQGSLGLGDQQVDLTKRADEA